MLKKIPLRIRFTLMASLFLLVSCVTLTLLSNASADSMMKAATVIPAAEEGSVPMVPLEPAMTPNEQYFRIFRQKTAAATVVIVLVGSIAAYFAAGYVLRPIRTFIRSSPTLPGSCPAWPGKRRSSFRSSPRTPMFWGRTGCWSGSFTTCWRTP